jgi:putative glutamine amidotransferase
MRFALGVQWHPEALELDTTIAGLVAGARARAAEESRMEATL